MWHLLLSIALLLPSVAMPQRSDALLRIAVVGDVGQGTEKVAAGIAIVHARTPLDAIVLTGDNFYPCSVTSPDDPRWSIVRPLSALNLPLYPVFGNHDYCPSGYRKVQLNAPLPHWIFPASQYTATSKLADFLFLDTTPFADGQDDISVPRAIRTGFPGGRNRWRIAVGHHVVVSSGWHGRFPRQEHARMIELLKPMSKARVDLYLCGHDHHLEMLDTRPRIVVSGAGSEPVPPIARRLKTVWPDDPMRTIGFAVIELTAEKMTVRFYDFNGNPLSRPLTFLKLAE
jgi:tartrate-resistant acid phosphatase type 5